VAQFYEIISITIAIVYGIGINGKKVKPSTTG
jgi:hypothetical protein